MEENENQKNEIKIPSEINLNTESQKELSEDKKIQEPKEFKSNISEHLESQEKKEKDDQEDKKIKKTLTLIKGLFAFLMILMVFILVIEFGGFTSSFKDKDFGAKVTLNNDLNPNITTNNQYEHTIINNNTIFNNQTIVVNVDDSVLKQIAEEISEDIKNKLNLSNSS